MTEQEYYDILEEKMKDLNRNELLEKYIAAMKRNFPLFVFPTRFFQWNFSCFSLFSIYLSPEFQMNEKKWMNR